MVMVAAFAMIFLSAFGFRKVLRDGGSRLRSCLPSAGLAGPSLPGTAIDQWLPLPTLEMGRLIVAQGSLLHFHNSMALMRFR